MRGHFFLLLVGIILTGCQSVRESPVVEKPVEWWDRAGDRLQELSVGRREKQYEAEVDALFAQPYIDPLTDYLRKYSRDTRRADQLRRVADERGQRCATVARRYEEREPSDENLRRYRAGYRYSCPSDVEAFALRVAGEADAGDVELVESAPADVVDVDQQADEEARALAERLNDCALLTTISNYTQAAERCLPLAEQGDAQAQANMALITFALQDYTQAARWAELAAPQSARASFLLGELYRDGLGVPSDRTLAQRWLEQAESLGHPHARASLEKLKVESL